MTTTSKRKPLKLLHGKRKALAEILGCSEMSVWRAMHYEVESQQSELIRKKAFEYGFVRCSR